MKAELENLTGNDLLGEGPLWDAAHSRLLWSDIKSMTIRQYSPASGERGVLSEGVMAFGQVLNRDGALIITTPAGLFYYRVGEEPVSLLGEYEGEALFLNDTIADSSGRIYAGTVFWGPDGLVKHGKLYLIDGAGSAQIVDSGSGMSNGLGFSPDDSTLYYTDSYTRRIYAFDVDSASGGLSNKRVLVQVPDDEGLPDGLTVDAEGHLWSAQWYGGQVVRYDPDGKVERRVPLPVRQVASLTFGGDALDELYITSASDPFVSALSPAGYDYDAGNHGGPLFRLRPGVQGRLEHLADIAPPAAAT